MTDSQILENLPDVEDALDKHGMFYFVGLFLYVSSACNELSALTSARPDVSPFLVDREQRFEQWLNSAMDYLPDWYTEDSTHD